MKHARLSVSPRYALTLFSLAALIMLAVSLLPFMHKQAEAKSVKASAATKPQTTSAAVVGQWGNLIQFQTVPVHISLLPNGKLLYWGRDKGTDNRDVKGGCWTYLVDPANFNQTTTIRNDTTNLFCSGHSFLPDGRLLVTGGHDKYDPSPLTEGIGERAVNTFDYKTNTWKKIGLMNSGRWYPYNVTLENGDVAIFAGSYWDGQTFSGGVPVTARNIYPDRYRYNSQGDGTITPFDISQEIGPQIEKYPFLHLAPDGKVFIAGPSTIVGFPSYMFDPTEPLPPGATHFRAYNPTGLANFTGSSVLYDAANGKIMVMGGSRGLGGATLQDASLINLSETTYPNSPPWRPAAPMSYKRKFHTATLLPDGKVLVSGGTQCTGANDLKCPDFPSGGAAALNPELWDPQTGLWTTMAPNPSGIPRVYHSTAILLPDATVLIGGGGLPAAYGEIPDGTDPSGDLARIFKHSDGEIFSPPYLFNSAGQPAARPVISSIQADKIGLGQTMQVVTPDASNISSVVLIRLGSVTHGFNQDQRRLPLSFAATGSNTLNITMPATGKLCPPGPYMLFLLNANGTPSVAKIITVLTEPQIITAGDTVWVEDNVPTGGIQEGNGEGWNWISTNPSPFSGTSAQQSNLVAGLHQHYFYGATNTLTVNTGDKLIAYVYLDPANLPGEVMLQWNDGTWEHRAYWGTNQIGLGVDGTASRRSMGALPPAGQWVRLEVPASLVGLEGRTLNGMAFTLYGGRATWDHAGKYAPPVNFALATNGGQAFASSTHPSGSFPLSAIINGDRTGSGWGAGTGGWSDGTPNQFPDYLEIHFNGEKLINEIDVTTLQDNYQSPVEPTPETTFSLFGITDYNVGYFDSTTNQWVYVAYIRNSLKVMNQIKLSGVVRTQKLSIVILNARSSNYPNNYSRVVEVEAWGTPAP